LLPGLPEPSLPLISRLRNAKVSDSLEDPSSQQQNASSLSSQATPSNSPGRSRRLRKDSLENLDADPWASPAPHKGHTYIVENEETLGSASVTAAKPLRNGLTEPSRTTSAFTTHSDDRAINSHPPHEAGANAVDSGGAAWGSYRAPGSGFPDQQDSGLDAVGFGPTGNETSHAGTGRALGGGRTNNRGVEETVTVALLPEKEGIFMFQHHNYEVKSARRGTSVVRRYSDFVWLLDCLHKRYPFRQLPLLPPKRVAGMTQAFSLVLPI